jgi:hypothetical protein
MHITGTIVLMMEVVLLVVLPGFVAVAAGLLAWFIMQSRMEVKLAEQRADLAEARGALDAEKKAIQATMPLAVRAAEESARRQSFDNFLNEISVEQRHYTRERQIRMQTRKSLVLQERMYFRNIPLSDWIEHEIVVDEGADVERLVQDMTIFGKSVVNIAEAPYPRKALA